MVATPHPLPMRAKILVEATRLFARHGYDGTSLQAIADAVGIKKPSLIHHFASKDLLRQAVLDAQLAHWNELLPRLVLAAAAGEDQFDAVTREIVRFFSTEVVIEELSATKASADRELALVSPAATATAILSRVKPTGRRLPGPRSDRPGPRGHCWVRADDGQSSRSMIVALAMPAPSHMVWSP